MKQRTAYSIKKLNLRIKKNWDQLSEEEIASYLDRPDMFYATIKHKYGMFRDDAERRMQQLEGGSFLLGWFH